MRPSIRDDAARSDDRLKHTQERQGRGSAAGHREGGGFGGRGGRRRRRKRREHTPALHAIWLVLVFCRLHSADPPGRVSASRGRLQLLRQLTRPCRGSRHLVGPDTRRGSGRCLDFGGRLVFESLHMFTQFELFTLTTSATSHLSCAFTLTMFSRMLY